VAEARAQGTELLDRAQALAGGLVPCATELHSGDPVDVICRRGEELTADLIVVGNRGLGTLDRFLLGSVSTAVVQRAPCSVLIVRRREPG
jgi:nucleotide-binding universal stress UspA family protein